MAMYFSHIACVSCEISDISNTTLVLVFATMRSLFSIEKPTELSVRQILFNSAHAEILLYVVYDFRLNDKICSAGK